MSKIFLWFRHFMNVIKPTNIQKQFIYLFIKKAHEFKILTHKNLRQVSVLLVTMNNSIQAYTLSVLVGEVWVRNVEIVDVVGAS